MVEAIDRSACFYMTKLCLYKFMELMCVREGQMRVHSSSNQFEIYIGNCTVYLVVPLRSQ